jgi:hypothetical protein
MINGDPDRQNFRGSAIKGINVFELFSQAITLSPVGRTARFARERWARARLPALRQATGERISSQTRIAQLLLQGGMKWCAKPTGRLVVCVELS